MLVMLDKEITVEPPNKGHFGTNHCVHRRDVLFSEVSKCITTMQFLGNYKVSFMRGCPFLEGSFIGGFNIRIVKHHDYKYSSHIIFYILESKQNSELNPKCHSQEAQQEREGKLC